MGCAIAVPPEQMSAIVRTESSAHPFAIGVVGGRLSRQPQSLVEAVTTVKLLRKGNFNYSVGMAQVNQVNFSAYQLHEGNMFDPCTNLQAAGFWPPVMHATGTGQKRIPVITPAILSLATGMAMSAKSCKTGQNPS